MKRLKLLACAVLMGVLAMGLCSCNYLDDLKAKRLEIAYEGDTANVVSLTGQGHTYTPVLQDSELGFFYSSEDRYVVKGDVPLLLMQEFGITASASEDGRLVKLGGVLYASDEMTAAEIEAVKKVKLDHYVMLVWDEENYRMSWLVLDDDITAAIRATLQGYAHNGMPSDTREVSGNDWKTYDTTDTFIAVDKDMIFMGADYQFSLYDNGKIFLMDWYEYAFYEVPEQYHAVVKAFYQNAYSKGDGMVPMPIAIPER